MSKEGSITPRTVRLTSPLFSHEYLGKQHQILEEEKTKLSAVSTQQSALVDDCKEKINKFFKLKPQDNKSKSKSNKPESKGNKLLIFEKIIAPKKSEIQKKIQDKEIELELLNNNQAFNSDPWLMKFYQPSVRPDEPLTELGKNIIPNLSIPLIPYFSINENLALENQHLALENQPLNTTELHSLEKYVFEEAIKYLENQCAADEYFKIREGEKLVSPNNVALVNFFPRSNKVIQKEKIPNSQVIETHTIVLWKVSENEIKVIDPSNSGSSSFLKNISVHNKFKFLIDEEKKSILKNIYQVDDKDLQGKSVEKRDCTDIAVKIGFELNQRQSNYEVITVQDCLQQSIEQISNTTPSSTGGLKLFKALQSSDLEVRKKAAELKETIQKLEVKDKSFLTELDLTKFDSKVEPKKIVEDIQELSELLGVLNDGDIL